MKENSIRRAVRERRAALGTGLKEFASRGVPWIIEASGFDYCMIDHEHGAFDLETIADLAGWFQATSVSPIVRIHKSFMHLIPVILDQGIMGIQISEVDNAAEARAIVALAKYPPIGNRGISGQGMHTGYKSYGARHATEYAPWANANIIVCPAIESLEGLENVEAIAAVEGIDMIAYGHSDLSARLGVHLQLEHPTFKAAVRRIATACTSQGKLARGSAETEAQIEEYWQLGCKVLNLPGTDVSTYLDGLKARATSAHTRLKSIGVPGDMIDGKSVAGRMSEDIDLEAFRVERGLTWKQLAELIGARNPGQAHVWALGKVRPGAQRLQQIAAATGGRVGVYAMHCKRLEWERAHPNLIEDVLPEPTAAV